MMRIGLYRKKIYDRKHGMCCYDTLSLQPINMALRELESLA